MPISNLIKTTYKFRLYPSKQQEQRLLWALNRCRFVYNYLLKKKTKEKLSRSELQALLPNLKKEFPELRRVHSKTIQYENYRLHSNIMALSRLKKNGKKVGRLRYKGKEWFKTFTYNQSGFRMIETEKRQKLLHLSKIGNIPIRKHREIKGNIKQITIKHHQSGKWYACIMTEYENNQLNKSKAEEGQKKSERKIGIDMGINNYAYDSDGVHFDNPKNLDSCLKKLSREQRRFSRKEKKSKNREKQRVRLAITHEKIFNKRDDFLHKLSHHYADGYDFIAVEELSVKNMVKNRFLAKSIMDSAWSKFILMLQYKAERAGSEVIKVSPKDTTQKCSRCGHKVKKSLSTRIHKCPICGLVIDRDYNAAINILKHGLEKSGLKRNEDKLEKLGQGLPEFTPAQFSERKMRRLSAKRKVPVEIPVRESMNQEASDFSPR